MKFGQFLDNTTCIFVKLFETMFRVLFLRPKMLFTNPLLSTYEKH